MSLQPIPAALNRLAVVAPEWLLSNAHAESVKRYAKKHTTSWVPTHKTEPS